MKGVNLLPERNRPRSPSGSHQRSSYLVLGTLGALLLALVVYVLTLNSINDSKSRIATAKAETARANAQADALGAYGDFAKIASQRVASVSQLAKGRADWERLVLELSRVLPDGVWLKTASAGATPADAPSSSGAPATTTTGPASAASGPVLALDGCARSQARVAVAMVRLRQLEGATDVVLQHSSQPDQQKTKTAATPTKGAQTPATDCASTHDHLNYEFQVNVSFAPLAQATPHAPTSLGGGS
ncbi:MAG: hypothetical protein NVSMB25_06650 [Thermoleophilaceae bacterium]